MRRVHKELLKIAEDCLAAGAAIFAGRVLQARPVRKARVAQPQWGTFHPVLPAGAQRVVPREVRNGRFSRDGCIVRTVKLER